MRSLRHEPSIGTALPNILPYVEVLIFILVATLSGAAGQSIDALEVTPVTPPVVPDAKKPASSVKLFKVAVTAKGDYFVFGKEADLDQVRSRFSKLSKKTVVMIKGDGESHLKAVARLMSAAQVAGLQCGFEVVETPDEEVAK